VRLDESELDAGALPKYRDMMLRLARDPVGQTLMFELFMRLFFIHVLGVRPECLQNRRRAQACALSDPWSTVGSSTLVYLGRVYVVDVLVAEGIVLTPV
jgi:hypothetical protein